MYFIMPVLVNIIMMANNEQERTRPLGTHLLLF